MKTLQTIKNEVAKEEGYENWNEATGLVDGDTDTCIIEEYGLVDKVAKRYAAQALKEASERVSFGGANRNMILDLINELK